MGATEMANADVEYATVGGVGSMVSMSECRVGHWLRSIGPSGFGSGSTAEQVAKHWDGHGKVAIVTGASGGLGLESARVLALRGCDVILAVRGVTKTKAAIGKLKEKYPEIKLTPMELDLANFASVRAFAAAFKALGKPLHILLLNAGVMASPFKLSVDGYEMQFATNHLGHFLLTELLLELIVESAKKDICEGRIVTVSSSAHVLAYPEGLRVVSLDSPLGYSEWPAYGQSKLCNILFTRELNERLAGKPVVAACCHPGCIQTDLQRHVVGELLLGLLIGWMGKSVPQGAATQVFLATHPNVQGGEYYSDVNIAPSSKLSHSKVLGRKVWEISGLICNED